MWLIDWLWSSIASWLWTRKARLLFLGLDNAGKTTLLHMLKDGRLGAHTPTAHPTAEEFAVGGTQCLTFDLGGHREARRLWKDYCTDVDAIVFIVDAADPGRFDEAKTELHALLEDEALAPLAFLILGNKVDQPRAACEADLRSALGLLQPTPLYTAGASRTSGAYYTRAGVEKNVELFMVSIVQRSGYKEAFEWLQAQM